MSKPLVPTTLLSPLNVCRRATALFSMALLLGACQVGGDSPSGTEGSSKALKIGSLLPVTGDLASVGEPMIQAIPYLVETVNQCGGVNGSPVELVSEDTETLPIKAKGAMAKLVEVDKVAGVVGAFGSTVSKALTKEARLNQVMLISPGSTSSEFTQLAKNGDFKAGDTQYWARTPPSDTYQARALAKLAQKKGFKRVSTVVINNDYGLGFEKEFIKAFKELGGTVINEAKPTRYNPTDPDFDTTAAFAFQGQPDAVIGVLYPETGAPMLKAAYEQGSMQGVQVMLTDGVYSEKFATDVGKTPEGKFILAGAIGTTPGADGAALDALTQLWQQEQKANPPAYAPQAWDAAALLVLGAAAAQSNEGAAIASKIRDVSNAPGTEVTDVCEGIRLLDKGEAINYQGASGNVDIDEYGDVVGVYDVWSVEKDGTLSIIDTVKPE